MQKLYFRLVLILLVITSCSSIKEAKFNDYIFETKSEKQSYLSAYNKALKLWDIPYTEENVKTSFGTAHVIIAGQKNAKSLVLLHGMDATSTMWYPNIKALAKNHRIYAIDFLMEPGKSAFTAKPLSSKEIVIWYNEIFSFYKLKQFDIIGASRGG